MEKRLIFIRGERGRLRQDAVLCVEHYVHVSDLKSGVNGGTDSTEQDEGYETKSPVLTGRTKATTEET